jgi:hypothetical protein
MEFFFGDVPMTLVLHVLFFILYYYYYLLLFCLFYMYYYYFVVIIFIFLSVRQDILISTNPTIQPVMFLWQVL